MWKKHEKSIIIDNWTTIFCLTSTLVRTVLSKLINKFLHCFQNSENEMTDDRQPVYYLISLFWWQLKNTYSGKHEHSALEQSTYLSSFLTVLGVFSGHLSLLTSYKFLTLIWLSVLALPAAAATTRYSLPESIHPFIWYTSLIPAAP